MEGPWSTARQKGDRLLRHVWQGRFKSFPIQHDDHFLTVIRYVVRNPVRAGLVAHSHEWPWSSLHFRDMIDPWTVERPMNVEQWINEPLFDHELCACVSA
jgi:putative transposase